MCKQKMSYIVAMNPESTGGSPELGTPNPDLRPQTPDPGSQTPEASPSPPAFPQAKGESDRAFEAFRVYLELGPKRRYLPVARRVGTSPRTVRRWAADFDWRGRIKTYAAGSARQFAETERAVQREELLDATARAKAFRDRQYALAEALLGAVEQYLERLEDADLDQMSLADACRVLEVASRLGQQAESRASGEAPASARSLRDQLAALLDQAYAETSSPTAAVSPPRSAITPQPQS